jgi:sulfate transport system ATP-binding protein
LELIRSPDGEIAEVEMTRERYATDPLQAGDLVFVKPRQLRVFLQDDAGVAPPMQLMHWNGDGDGI